MIHRWPLIISMALTAFVLVIGGALAGQVLNREDVTVTTEPSPTEAGDPLEDPEVLALLDAREAEYQELIQEANQQLTEAYRTQQELAEQLAPPAESEVPLEYSISHELAAGLALSVAPNSTSVEKVELVLFQGMPAYEVILDSGTVYIGAENGWLLHNGAATVQTDRSSGGEHDDDDDEHEHEDDD